MKLISHMMKHIPHYLFIILCYFSSGVSAEVIFKQTNWQAKINPATLAVTVDYLAKGDIQLSQGGDTHHVSVIQQSDNQASWLWDDGAYQVDVSLVDQDIIFTIQAKQAGKLMLLNQSDISLGHALSLPIAEGHYIPVDQPIWKTFLSSELDNINTTQDLSLPLWTNEYDHFSASWLLLNPYNNQLQFHLSKQDQLSLSLNHQFTRLSVKQPMIMLLTISNKDPIAGAKRYRQWLIDNNLFESFTDKIKRQPEAEKLVGATHLYVWGSDLLSVKDIKDWSIFLKLLKSDQAFSRELTALFDKETLSVLANTGNSPDRYQKKVLINAFNNSLKTLARQAWQTKEPDFTQLPSHYARLTEQVSDVFANALTTDKSHWGAGFSTSTIEQLAQSGLLRLWIGIGDGWEGGLWHPQAVQAAVQSGFLVAPYDSYQTALPLNFNPDWATAHLGEQAYKDCAITEQNGALKAGFQKSGHYTNPVCIRPWLEKRVTALKANTGFNSWFLDAYATGMVFDDYSANHPLSQADNAKENSNSMLWTTEKLSLITGSEDGNAVTSRGIFFAHGMQTPVIGWGDTDLTNPKSPYYLGRWYPNNEPSVFFKSTPLKEPYKTIYFTPVYRLPLYQTVFHDSVITSQHWLFDNLKLSNTLVENQLTQLFYNVPALYHISENTLKQRLPSIIAQDAFFQPLHKKLIKHSIVHFKWLTDDKKLQQIIFSDGTILTANFSANALSLNELTFPPYSVTAQTPELQGKPSVYTIHH